MDFDLSTRFDSGVVTKAQSAIDCANPLVSSSEACAKIEALYINRESAVGSESFIGVFDGDSPTERDQTAAAWSDRRSLQNRSCDLILVESSVPNSSAIHHLIERFPQNIDVRECNEEHLAH